MTTQDARERAWEKAYLGFHASSQARFIWNTAWDAAKREDEQRIAALVGALVSADSMLTLMWHRYRSRIPDEIATEFEETIREVTKHSRRHTLAGSEESGVQ